MLNVLKIELNICKQTTVTVLIVYVHSIFDRVNKWSKKKFKFPIRVGVTKHLKYWSINSGECAVMLFIRGSKCK